MFKRGITSFLEKSTLLIKRMKATIFKKLDNF